MKQKISTRKSNGTPSSDLFQCIRWLTIRVRCPRFNRFKLHLGPESSRAIFRTQNESLPPLPRNKTAVDILADFLRYLFQCTKNFIIESHLPGGAEFWKSFGDRIDYVLSHPNGWEGREQSSYRRAALLAGLVGNEEEGHERISFVTEGEASLHYCINKGLEGEISRVSAGFSLQELTD
jgi:hypothetical protein